MIPLPRRFVAALALTFLSGAAGLAHQVLWTRRMVDVLGANADTFSKVVGAFFVGLAVGAWMASRDRAVKGRFWKRVAAAEVAVALLALPVLFSMDLAEMLAMRPAVSAGMKWILPLLLVAPPAIAMGLVIPWMVRGLARNEWFTGGHAVSLYAVNTFGGVAGIVFVVAIGLPQLGLTGAGLVAVILNLIVAGGAFVMSNRGARNNPELPSEVAPRDREVSTRWLGPALALASGFLVLSLEVILQHQLAQVTINSFFSSATVLALVLVSLTLAALVLPWLVSLAGDERRALNWALIFSVMCCAAQPFLLFAMRGGVKILPYELPALEYFREVLELGLVAICPVFFASGLIFPLLLRSVAAVEGGRRVGSLLAWNGVGGWLGAELGQAWIAPWFGLWASVTIIAALYVILWLVHEVFARRTADAPVWGNRVLVRGTILVVLVGGMVVSFRSASALPKASLAPGEKLHAFKVGREGAVATLECGPGDWRMLFNNSYTLGGSRAQYNQERQSLLPLLLHGAPKSVANLGVATGSTVAGSTLDSRVERIDAVELSPLVLRYAREFFGPYNREVFADARVRFIQEDARWLMARERAAYDVVVGDLFLPWRTGEGRLFAIEHFQNVKRSLKPGGLFCQWLPMFQLTRPQFETIARTFRQVFPEAFLVRGDFYAELPILGLVGGRSMREINWQLVEAGCARLRSDGRTTDPLMRHSDGVAMLMLGPLPELEAGPINNLANAWLEWDAGRNILGMTKPWFVGVPYAEFVRDVQRANREQLPEWLRDAQESGQFFLTLEIVAKLNLPALAEMKSQLAKRLPATLGADTGADWSQWPMRIKPVPEKMPTP